MNRVATPGYLRFPHIHGDLLAFVAEDDVWLAPADGGRAWRLTSDGGQASHPWAPWRARGSGSRPRSATPRWSRWRSCRRCSAAPPSALYLVCAFGVVEFRFDVWQVVIN